MRWFPTHRRHRDFLSYHRTTNYIDFHTVCASHLLGTSPSFQPPEGGKAVSLRMRSVIHGFAGFAALEPGHLSTAFL
nr:hypothetical protein pM02_c2_01 [uncultured bacterium]